MVPKLYYSLRSTSSRATLLTVKALGLEVELKPLSLSNQEHLTPEFLKLNPLHTIPTLEDDGFVIWDSHVVNGYLVDKYGENDGLYPKDLRKRAIIDIRLHFDSNIIAPRLRAITESIMKSGAKAVAKDRADALVQGYTFLETLLENKKYVANNVLSIADFSLVASISTANLLVPVAANRFPAITDWVNRMEQLPYYAEGNQEGLNMYASILKTKLKG